MQQTGGHLRIYYGTSVLVRMCPRLGFPSPPFDNI